MILHFLLKSLLNNIAIIKFMVVTILYLTLSLYKIYTMHFGIWIFSFKYIIQIKIVNIP